MKDGDTNARCRARIECVGVGLYITLTRGENTGSSMLPELVDAAAERETELVDEVLPLQVGAELRAVVALRERDVEVVLPHVAAVREDVVAASTLVLPTSRSYVWVLKSSTTGPSVSGSVASRFGATRPGSWRRR
jgi:hypothetical protein